MSLRRTCPLTYLPNSTARAAVKGTKRPTRRGLTAARAVLQSTVGRGSTADAQSSAELARSRGVLPQTKGSLRL